jgi:predicted DNA-binding protein
MSKAQMSLRMPDLLMTKLNDYAQHSGLSKTEIVVRAIASYLQLQEDNSLEQRMAKLEAKIIKMEKQLKTI